MNDAYNTTSEQTGVKSTGIDIQSPILCLVQPSFVPTKWEKTSALFTQKN